MDQQRQDAQRIQDEFQAREAEERAAENRYLEIIAAEQQREKERLNEFLTRPCGFCGPAGAQIIPALQSAYEDSKLTAEQWAARHRQNSGNDGTSPAGLEKLAYINPRIMAERVSGVSAYCSPRCELGAREAGRDAASDRNARLGPLATQYINVSPAVCESRKHEIIAINKQVAVAAEEQARSALAARVRHAKEAKVKRSNRLKSMFRFTLFLLVPWAIWGMGLCETYLHVDMSDVDPGNDGLLVAHVVYWGVLSVFGFIFLLYLLDAINARKP